MNIKIKILPVKVFVWHVVLKSISMDVNIVSQLLIYEEEVAAAETYKQDSLAKNISQDNKISSHSLKKSKNSC